MFGFFKEKVNEVKKTSDIAGLIRTHGPKKAGEIMRESALSGNLICQIGMSQAGLLIPEEKRTKQMNDDVELFTRMAAEGGDVGSQFNLALIYIKRVNVSNHTWSDADLDYMHKSKYWHEKAAAQGCKQSIKCINDINVALGVP